MRSLHTFKANSPRGHKYWATREHGKYEPGLMCAGLPYMGMPARAHSAVPVSVLALLRCCCALLSASWINVRTLFEIVSIKCFLRMNEGQLTLLNFPKEASTRQKLIAFLFLVDLFTSSQ